VAIRHLTVERMAAQQKCAQCGTEMPIESKWGLCLRCLLVLGLTWHEDQTFEEESAVVASDNLGSTPVAGERSGDIIGRFRLLRLVGRGGFGEVFLAEQQEPVRRLVALKIIKLGMDTKEVIARFELERQALAMMDHPNIAKVLDAGATNAGRPYFVMDWVEGIQITRYCDEHRLSMQWRLELFIQVCQAVQHAHQKGIIHRDIKPSNVLVTEVDDKPLAKVIDFGIAKATVAPHFGEQSVITKLQQFPGTPAYMSPEQAGLGGLDIDSRSDIYSLGMLLYELLTAQPAFESGQLVQSAMDEVFQIIREKEPPRPSARITTLSADKLKGIARNRQTDVHKLTGVLRGELDWIVMKALEKDRNRRYETASGLAMDIRRHLRNEEVLARPPDRIYRFRKLLQKNKMEFFAVSAICFALVAGAITSLWLAQRARRAEQEQVRLREKAVAAAKRAEIEAIRSGQVAKFLKDMLTGVGPSVALGRDTTMLREILEKTVARVEKDLKDEPEIAADLCTTIGSVYLALGSYEKAEAFSRQALKLRDGLVADNAKEADTLNGLGNALYKQGKLVEAEKVCRKALGERKRLLRDDDPAVASSLSNLANVLWAEGNLTEAEAMHREALKIRKGRLGEENQDTVASLDNLSGVLSAQGKLAEAEAMQRQAVGLNQKLFGQEHPDLAFSMNNLADTLHAEGKLAEAEDIDRKVLAMRRRLLGREHPDVAFSLNNLATVLQSEGKLQEAETMQREALAMRRKLLGERHIDVAGSLNNLAAVLIERQKFSEAETLQREALSIQKEVLGLEHQDIAGSLSNLGDLLWLQGKFQEAEAVQREALAMFQKVMGKDSLDAARTLNDLGTVLCSEAKLTEAEATQVEGLAIRTNLLGNQHPDVGISMGGLAGTLFECGRFAEAEELQRQELAIWRRILAKEPDQMAAVNGLVESLAGLSCTVLAQRKYAVAEPLTRECCEMCKAHLSDDWRFYYAKGLLGESLLGQGKNEEAEPILVASNAGLTQMKGGILLQDRLQIQKLLKRIVFIYKASKMQGQADEWAKRLQTWP
jgi:serine/threonine protein kinase/Tfp pilus assembly protein PilF